MNISREFQTKVGNYVAKKLSLEELRHWMAEHLWDASLSTSDEELLGEVEIATVHLHDQLLTEDTIREQLSACLTGLYSHLTFDLSEPQSELVVINDAGPWSALNFNPRKLASAI